MWKYLRALRNRGADDERPLPYVDPLRAGRHPFQIYMLTLCVVAGAPYLFGYATAEAVEKQLPVWMAAAWGIMLFFGAVVALIGSFWRGSFANALTMERVGLSLTGGAALVYGLCIIGTQSILAALLVIGIYIGYLLLRVPITNTRLSVRATQRLGDLLTVLGIVFITSNMTFLVFTPALSVLTASFIILGFGLSCLTRARDIEAIFKRANEKDSTRILREHQRG